jgi:hypothetical protein
VADDHDGAAPDASPAPGARGTDASSAAGNGEAAGDREEGDVPEPSTPDPEVPEPETPDVAVPEAPEPPDPEEADPTLRRQFWRLVAVFNVALLALAVGAMVVVFRGRWTPGVQLVAAGLVVFVYGYYRYRQAKASLADDGDAADAG